MNDKVSVCYLVLAYRDPRLLGQLTDWLSRGSSTILVHVDSGVEQAPFEESANPIVRFVSPRFSCPWGTWGRVGASLAMLFEAVESGSSHIVLLSEDSFPLHDPVSIPTILESSGVGVWMDGELMGSKSKPMTRLSRISHHRGDPRKQSRFLKILQALPFTYEKVDHRRHLGEIVPWAGDSWWILTNKAATDILEFSKSNPDTMEFFSRTWIPDEHFFQSVVARVDPSVKFRGTPILADWSSGNSKFPPYFFDINSIDTLRAGKSDYLFARKLERFDDDMTQEIESIWENN